MEDVRDTQWAFVRRRSRATLTRPPQRATPEGHYSQALKDANPAYAGEQDAASAGATAG